MPKDDDKEIKKPADEQDDETRESQGKKTKPKDEWVPKAKFDELNERLRQQEATLQALQRGGQQPQANRPAPSGGNSAFLREASKIISEELGFDPNEVFNYVSVVDSYVNRVAQQTIFPALNTLFDGLDEVRTRQTYTDYNDFAEDIQRERDTRLQKGQYLSRQEAYEIVKGRKLPEILAAERERASQDRDDTPINDFGGDPGVSKAGPSQGARSRRSLPTVNDAQRMSREELESSLADMGEF